MLPLWSQNRNIMGCLGQYHGCNTIDCWNALFIIYSLYLIRICIQLGISIVVTKNSFLREKQYHWLLRFSKHLRPLIHCSFYGINRSRFHDNFSGNLSTEVFLYKIWSHHVHHQLYTLQTHVYQKVIDELSIIELWLVMDLFATTILLKQWRRYETRSCSENARVYVCQGWSCISTVTFYVII